MSHIHVVANVPGFLPESDIYCVESADDAASAVKEELQKLGLDTQEGCDRDGCNVCGWCRKGNAILAKAQAETMGRLVKQELSMFGSSSWNVEVPCSPGYVIEAINIPGARTACEHYASEING